MADKVTLKYTLHDNALTNKGKYARLVDPEVADMEDIAQQMTQNGSIIKTTELEAVLNDFWRRVVQNLKEGVGFRNEYITIGLVAEGTFDENDEAWDSKKHRLKTTVRLRPALRKAVPEAEMQQVHEVKTLPEITRIRDIGSKTENKLLTPEGILIIEGKKLKVYTTKKEQGVVLIQEKTGKEWLIHNLFENKPKKLMLQLPGKLPKGRYALGIRNSSGKDATRLRQSMFLSPLTVE